MDVYILCGGLGKRLRRVSGNTPKSMMRVGDRPFLDMVIAQFLSFGLRRFILGVGYKAKAIKDYYSSRRNDSFTMLFSEEKTPLDTGGAVKKASSLIKSDLFFVLNGDSFIKFNPKEMVSFHKKNKALVSILVRKANNASEYGEIHMDRHSRITGFNEKNKNASSRMINAGVYIFDKKVFKLMPSARKFSLEQDFFPRLINKNIYGYKSRGYFIDIGTPARYLCARRYFGKR